MFVISPSFSRTTHATERETTADLSAEERPVEREGLTEEVGWLVGGRDVTAAGQYDSRSRLIGLRGYCGFTAECKGLGLLLGYKTSDTD